jgi:hypothetical protein
VLEGFTMATIHVQRGAVVVIPASVKCPGEVLVLGHLTAALMPRTAS